MDYPTTHCLELVRVAREEFVIVNDGECRYAVRAVDAVAWVESWRETPTRHTDDCYDDDGVRDCADNCRRRLAYTEFCELPVADPKPIVDAGEADALGGVGGDAYAQYVPDDGA